MKFRVLLRSPEGQRSWDHTVGIIVISSSRMLQYKGAVVFDAIYFLGAIHRY